MAKKPRNRRASAVIEGEQRRGDIIPPKPRDVLVVTDDLAPGVIDAEPEPKDTFQQIGHALPALRTFGDEKRETGRPTLFTEELWENILCDLASGMTLKQICADDEMPSPRTIHRWLIKNPGLQGGYAFAQQLSINSILDHVRDIAHRRHEDELGKEIEQSRLAINTDFAVLNNKQRPVSRAELIEPGRPGDNAKVVSSIPPEDLVTYELSHAEQMKLATKEFEKKTGIAVPARIEAVAPPAPEQAT